MNEKMNIGSILIVGDSPPLADKLAKGLSRFGYEIHAVKTGEQVLASIHEISPDLILMDMMLPDGNALDVCRHLKNDAIANGIPVILLGENLKAGKRLKVFEAGVVDYFTKPMDVAELLPRIEVQISLRHARGQLSKQALELQFYDKKNGRETGAVGKRTRQESLNDEKELNSGLDKGTALQMLKSRDDRYRILVDNANEAILVVQDGAIKFANQSAVSLTGWSLQELKSEPYMKLVHSDDRATSLEKLEKKSDTGKTHSRYVIRLVTKKEQIKWTEISTVMIKWEGRPASLNFITDISERKLAEDALLRERLGLEQSVQERTAALRASLQELTSVNLRLEETGRYKSQFLSSMNHELRTPLNSIIGFSELLNNHNFGTLNEKQSKYASLIESSGKQLLSLITDLIDLSRIDAGNMVLELSVFRPWEFVGTIAEMMGMQFRKKELQISIDIPHDAGFVSADLKKCKQIMVILLSNAIKYSSVGGKISVRVSKETGKMLRVELEDTGVGISEADCMKLFTDYYQIDKPHDEQLGGTGIELALSRKLVELQGGQIGVKSILGKGSTFWFTLPNPTVSAENEALPEAKGKGAAPLVGWKILVAEDDERNMILLTEILSLWEHQIIVARNGQEAIDLFMAGSPDLIFMDLRMPVKSGLEAVAMIRKIEKDRDGADESVKIHVPIIALTASVGPETKQSVMKAGFDMYLSKPAGIAEIEDVLGLFLK